MGNCGSASAATRWQQRYWQQQREQHRQLQQHVQQHTCGCWQTDVRADVLHSSDASIAVPPRAGSTHDPK